MRAAGREGRYHVTKRKDGNFDINDLSGYKPKQRTLKMKLCYYCMQDLQSKRLYFNPFSLSKYFDQNESHIPKTITQTITSSEIQTYTPDHNDIAREYKKAVNYCCQSCTVNCSSNKSLLDLHHKNGNPADNRRKNLEVLCLIDHAEKRYHTQVLNRPNAREKVKEIKRLRAEQGILDLD